ncbi:hypothetical protein ACH427_04535 [Streptomyces sp. NPDC020379]|uniref:hypothetical protein n=1 Tax=Streptomyces sp. NPDC020379 TaxID=3365071 RepID=UPI0037922C36
MNSIQPRPGGQPTITAVIRCLKDAGFQHSRYTETHRARTRSGFYVRKFGRTGVTVVHREGDADFFDRMHRGGYTDVTEVPDSPMKLVHVREYADVLASRYDVHVESGALYLSARSELPARPKGVPTAAQVRTALADAGITAPSGALPPFTVLNQPDHVRVAVANEDVLDRAVEALASEGWVFEQSETSQHFAIKITGATPDRRERVRKLRAARAERAAHEDGPEEPVPAAEAPQPAAAASQEPVSAPEVPVAPPARPQLAPRHYSRSGVAYAVGMRVTYRDRSGLWRHGQITAIKPNVDGQQQVHIAVDAYQAAPPRRAQPLMSNKPGKRHTDISTGTLIVALDDKDLMREQTDPNQQPT